MADCLTCCPGTPWWAVGRCPHPEPRCWHFLHLRSPLPEPRCLPSASHSPLCEAGNYIGKVEGRLFKQSLVCLNIHHINVRLMYDWLCVCVCVCVSMFLPDSKDPAEIIHDIIELNLQVFQDVAGFHTQLKYGHGNTHTELVGVIGQGGYGLIMTPVDTFG